VPEHTVSQRDREGPLVLVVDDDRVSRLVMRSILEGAGFRVAEATSGVEALEFVASRPPDVILLDVLMPDMDGYAACEALRRIPSGKHIPVVMVTMLDDVASINRAYESGATDFVTKPIKHTILPHRIRYMIRARETADELRTSRERLSNAQRIAKLGNWHWNAAIQQGAWSEEVYNILGFPPQDRDLTLERLIELVHVDDRANFRKVIDEVGDESACFKFEHRVVRRDGAERIIQQSGEVEIEHGSRVIVGTLQDVTERRLAEQRIHYLAQYDALTGLPNRAYLANHVRRAVEHAKRHDQGLAVIALGIDDFKRVNETLGHGAGDKLLAHVASRLVGSVRRRNADAAPEPVTTDMRGDSVARVGSDEFVVVLTEIADPSDAAYVVHRISEALSKPFVIGKNELQLTASAGVSAFPQDTEDPETLLKYADLAMHQAKNAGRGTCQFHTETTNARAMRRFWLEANLRKALERSEFAVHFQPKLDIQNGGVVGVEALARWIHPEEGMITPGEFIPVAEETGLILPIGEWVLKTACEQVQAWHNEGFADLALSVNLSMAQFRDTTLAVRIGRALKETSLDPRFLELELTESVLADTNVSFERLQELKRLGLSLSIDDFGTGYSSLSYLKRFPLTALKIDRSFIGDLSADSDDAAIVAATIALAHSLRLRVVAEGVEKLDQLEYLQELGCDEVQGYLFSKPLPAAAFADWMREGSWRDKLGRMPAIRGAH